MWNLLGVNTIGAGRFSFLILILIVKFLSIILSYQLTKNLFLEKKTKIIFFIVFTSILISMSSYTVPLNYSYFSYRDIFIILFLIFFIDLFISDKSKLLFVIFISLISTISILFHIDIGFYTNFILLSYVIYLFIIKKYKEIFTIVLSLIVFWSLVIYLIGNEEFKAFIDHTLTMISSVDLMHGMKHPVPFLSINETEFGTRATRGLLLQITAGLFVIHYLFLDEKKLSSSQKIFFLFLFLISFIMYKNALGRSDTNHLRMSADFPILINCFFIFNYLLVFFDKKILNRDFLPLKFIFVLIIIFTSTFYFLNHNKLNFNNIKNFKNNFVNYINYNDYAFIDADTKELIDFYKKINLKDECVQIFTFDLAMPYLLKKPSCTKYFSSWLASPINKQESYVNDLKKIEPEYILYKSRGKNFDLTFKVEPPEVYERLELVNLYILKNYKKFKELNGYVILKKK